MSGSGTEVSYLKLRSIAENVVEEAAHLIKTKRAELVDLESSVEMKSSAVDPVTVLDTMAENFISSRLGEIRPEDGVIGEEGAGRPSLSSVTWIVDPIDGTVNFLYGIPHYSVSLAAAIDGEVIAGAVINIATEQLYSASKEGGATVKTPTDNFSLPLQVNRVKEIDKALIATGFSYLSHWRHRQSEILTTVLPQCRDIRRIGSAALDLCRLASGQVDAFYEHGLNCWDFAAGSLIATEAGARIHAPSLSTPGRVGEVCFAASRSLFDELEALLDRAGGLKPMPR